MGRERPILLPKHERILQATGENLRLARLRRRLSVVQVAERSAMSRSTLYLIEKGDPGVSLGNFFRVMAVLGLEEDFLTLAQDDKLGRKLQDAGLKVTRKRAPKRKSESIQSKGKKS